MKYLYIFPYYLGWHYGRGLLEMFIHFKNFLFFVPRFFSIGTLSKTLISPLQRLKEYYAGGLEIEKFLEVVVVNILMRLLGLVVRSFMIITGLFLTVLTFVIEIFLFLIWLVIPFFLAFIFISYLVVLVFPK